MSEVYKIVLTTIDMLTVMLILFSVYKKKEYKAEIVAVSFIMLNVLGLWVM